MKIGSCSCCKKEHTTRTAKFAGKFEGPALVLFLFTCDNCFSTFTGKKGFKKCQKIKN
jgi:hypothetical protein